MGLFAVTSSASVNDASNVEELQKVGLMEVVSWVPGVLASITVLLAQVLGRAGISGFMVLTIATGLVASALYGVTSFLFNNRRGFSIRPTVHDGVVAFSYGLVAIVLVQVALHGSTFSPVTFSVDLAHHGAVVEWMRVHQVIPTGSISTLDGQANYPAGSYTVTSVISWVTGVAPLQAMWLVAIALIVSIWMISGSILHSLTGQRGKNYWLVPIAISLACWRFTLGMVTYDFFFAQLFGIWIALSSVAAMVWWSLRQANLVLIVGVAILGSAACLFSYPQSAPIPILACLAQVLSLRPNRRTALAGAAVGAGAISAVFAYSRSTGVDLRAITGSGEGARTPITVALVGGWIVLWLFIVGLIELGFSSRIPGARSLIGAMAAPSMLATALALLRLKVFGGYPVTEYRIQKNFYALIPFAVIVASFAVAKSCLWFSDQFETNDSGRFVAVRFIPPALVSLVVFASLFNPAEKSLLTYPIVSRDEYKAMSWATNEGGPNQVGMAFAGLTGYHLWWMKSGRPVQDLYPSMGSQRRLTRWDDWPANQPERFLVSSGSLANNYQTIPGVRVVFRSGEAFVFERTV